MMEFENLWYIYDNMLLIIEYEKIKLYFKNGVVGDIFAWKFGWWMI
jgi:hypothetical protein